MGEGDHGAAAVACLLGPGACAFKMSLGSARGFAVCRSYDAVFESAFDQLFSFCFGESRVVFG